MLTLTIEDYQKVLSMYLKRILHKENLTYLILWIIVLVGYTLHISSEHAERKEVLFSLADFVNALRDLFPLIFIFLVNNFILLPYWASKQNLAKYVIAVCLLILSAAIYQYFDFKREEAPIVFFVFWLTREVKKCSSLSDLF